MTETRLHTALRSICRDLTEIGAQFARDLSDIARLMEADPKLKTHVPQEILSKIPQQH